MTDQEIERILHRAAELQGLKTRSLDSPPTTHDEQRQLAFVAEAAEEAGISARDFAFATAEATGSPGQKPVAPKTATKARRWLGEADRALALEARMQAPPTDVLATFKAVLAGPEYQVAFSNVVGQDPLVDGVLVFEPADLWQVSLGQYSKFRYVMASADFRQVLLTIRPDPASPHHSVVRFHVSLDHAARLNYWIGLPTSLALGALTGLGLAGLLAGSLGTGAALALGAVTGTGAYFGLKAGLGALYRWAVRWGQKALGDLVNRVNQTWRLKGL